jgi:hypothetical protein
MKENAPTPGRLFVVDRCAPDSYGGGLGVFFLRDFVIPAGKAKERKALVLRQFISGELLFSNAEAIAALAKHNYPSLMLSGVQESGVLVGLLALANHVCSSNDDCLSLRSSKHSDVGHVSSVTVNVLRVGTGERRMAKGSQLLVTYDGRNHYGSPFPGGCGCSRCSGVGQLDVQQESVCDDDSSEDESSYVPPGRRKRLRYGS